MTLLRESGEAVGVISVNRLAGAIADDASHAADEDAEARLHRGIKDRRFEVYYQPVNDLVRGDVIGIEALLRWNDTERGVLMPADFLAAAERSGLIVELGDLVLDTACRQAAEWRRGGADISLAVNLSTRQLSDPGLVDRIVEALAASGLDPAFLSLEITETSLVQSIEEATEALLRLVDLGIGVAIDDFGTGWASLTYLRTFPVNSLKIDRSFVAGVGHDPNDRAIVRSILSLGAELDLLVVAEGIETVGQQTALEKLGCSIAQGFLYGRPTPASEVPIHRARRLAPPAGAGPSRDRLREARRLVDVGAGAPAARVATKVRSSQMRARPVESVESSGNTKTWAEFVPASEPPATLASPRPGDPPH